MTHEIAHHHGFKLIGSQYEVMNKKMTITSDNQIGLMACRSIMEPDFFLGQLIRDLERK